MKTFLSLLICILAGPLFAADGYLTVTNGTTIGGAAGGGGAGDVTQAGQNNFSGSNYFGSSTTFAAPPLGNGSGLTNLNVSTATGTLPDVSVPTVALTNNDTRNITFTGSFTDTRNGVSTVIDSNTITTGTINATTGNAGTLTITNNWNGALATNLYPTNLNFIVGAGLLGVTNNGILTISTNGQTTGASRLLTNTIVSFLIDGGGSTITTGTKNGFPVAGDSYTISGWSITAMGNAPTCTIDIWKIASGTALPTVANTIMGTKPALSSGNVIESTTLTAWNTAVTKGDIWGINVDACANATNIVFQIFGYR